MKCRNCPVCEKEIGHESPICTHCNKGVFVVDFGESAASLVKGHFFDRPNAYEICGWYPIYPIPDCGPKNRWECRKYEPVNFLER